LTVTFWPVGVDRVKLDVDTLLTVPVDPPAAGPDRAFDAPPPLAGVVVADGDVVVAVGVAAQPAITADIIAAAAIHPIRRFGSDRRAGRGGSALLVGS
jgi:hypothetical protein